MQKDENKAIKCPYCRDTKCLDQQGIVRIFLFPRLPFLILAVLAAAGGYFFSSFLYLAAIVLFLLPLALADLRLYLFPAVSVMALVFRKKVNCPKCNPAGGLFRNGEAEKNTVDKFEE